MISGKIRPTKKPDCDNTVKIICDALNELAYKDDSQIVTTQIAKYYAKVPRTFVKIMKVALAFRQASKMFSTFGM